MTRWITRLNYAWRRHGPLGFPALLAHNLAYYAFRRRHAGNADPPAGSFDAEYGTDTRGERDIGTLDIVASPSAVHAGGYQASGKSWVHGPLEKLEIEFARFTFIDFGSGKGRVILVAAAFPFKEIVGVEFSRELHEIALENIARFPRTAIRAGTVRSVHGDAIGFELPRSDLVCYFYDPFGLPIIEPVAGRLLAHHRQYGYDVIVIYVKPRHRTVFERTGQFAIIEETEDLLVLRAK